MMSFSRIRWRIALPYMILIAAIMAALSAHMINRVQTAYTDDLAARMSSEVKLLATVFQDVLATRDSIEAQRQVRSFSASLDTRITLIEADGTVLADSDQDPATLDNHFYRPEVQAALAGNEGRSTRYSNSVNYDMLYVARAVYVRDNLVGVVREAVPLSDIDTSIRRLRRDVAVGLYVALLLALGLAILIAERTVRPIRDLRAVVHRMSEGHLSAHLVPSTRDEVGELTEAFNVMSDRMRETIHSLDTERAQLAGVLENMADGVVITGPEAQVELINPAARRILGVPAALQVGASLAAMVRQHEIIAVWQACHDQGTEQVELVEVARANLFLQVVVTPLAGAEPGSHLMVLQDLSHVRRLETVRREFVSNISHELRTPLASLKALAETLRDGALDDPPAAVHFLTRIDHEVDTLSQMTEELLELSRIESGQVPMRLLPLTVSDFVMQPVERLRPQAERAGLEIIVDLPKGLPNVLGDVDRLRQVVTNLTHNAIKFTPFGGKVFISARVAGDEVEVQVRDTGIGMPAEVLERIFERFYKRDRSRSEPGTGLGLAIAKHVVQSHGGTIWAESTEGVGSTFHFTVLRADGLMR